MKDGSFSYLHLSNPNIATYIETWHNEPMPFDDIEPPQIHNNKQNGGGIKNGEVPSLDNEDDDPLQGNQAFGVAGNSSGGGGGAGGSGAGGRGLKGNGSGAHNQWMDLQLHEVFKEDIKRFQDTTILPNIEQRE
ncbi:hypothetical protein CANMA_003479 [Candida margitis]|uniref:uncharacterized protein n=1 Tax=Candida margitis TaxID=1775924 RepID=UPI0022265896|nr:uncharacterized protein CANMA_003479 [Candida margitis]KAI5964969.1 hypothetical protein CANMA_003479 [Candida margitis]